MRSVLVVGSSIVIAAGAAALLLSFGDIRLFPIFFPFALGFGLVLGLPLYFLIRARRRAGWRSALLAGAFVGAVLPALLVLAVPAPDQASVGGVATAIDGHYTGYGWIQNLLLVGMFGGIGGLAGLIFWSLVRREDGENRPKAEGPWPRRRIALLGAGAAATIAAAAAIPVLTRDRSCHNTMRDGRSSIASEAGFELIADSGDWRAIAGEVESFGRSDGWSILSDVRPDGDFLWFQMSLCREPGTDIDVQGMADLRRVFFYVYQPQGGTSWREPFARLYARIRHRWPGRTGFQGPNGEPVGPPDWVPKDAQTPSQSRPPGRSSAL